MRARSRGAINWSAASLGVAVLLGSPLPARSADGPQAGATVLPVTSVGGRPVILLRLNHQGPFRFFVDTGAGGNVLKASLVAELALTRTGIQRVFNPASGSAVDADIVSVATVEAAPLDLGPLTFVALDMARHGDVHGVLSVRSFPPGLVVFDLASDQIRIEPGGLAAEDPGVIPYEPAPVVSIEGEVAGRPVTFHLDTGSPDGVTIPGALARELSFDGDLVVTRERGRLVVKTGKLKGTVRFGPVVLDNPEVQVVDLFPDFGNIGSAFLRGRTLTIDREHLLLRIGTPQGLPGT